MGYTHFTKDSNYLDYINPLCKLSFHNAVLDRHGAFCEIPYATCMHRTIKFNLKQLHNLLTMTLIQNPVIVLCTHKPLRSQYPSDQYLPYDLWDMCMGEYRNLLNTHGIIYTEYDYAVASPHTVDYLYELSVKFENDMAWWYKHWTEGYGCAGSPSPKILLVAERIGPNNSHNIPFETGPTGQMLSNMLYETRTPLGSLTITNMVKSFRRDTRQVNDRDVELLDEEITNLKPKKVIFMGSPARKGVPIAKAHGCETGTIVHLGSLNHKGITDMSGYHNEWRKLIGLVPVVSFK